MELKLLLVTTLAALDPAVVSRLERLGYTVEVVSVEGLEPGSVARALEGRSFDYAIVPGSSPYDYSGFRGRVVKGPVSLKALPYILEVLGPQRLSPSTQAEKLLDPQAAVELHRRVLREVLLEALWAFEVRGLRAPLRPPPMLVASDVYVRGDREAVVAEVSYRVSEGADLVVLSASPGVDRRVYLDIVSSALDSGIPVAVDVWDVGLIVEAIDIGAQVAMSFTIETLQWVPARYRDRAAYVIIPRLMGDWRLRVEELLKAYREALNLGFSYVILDPVVNPPVNRGLLTSLIAASELAGLARAPIMLGLNNAVEMMDVDTHATIGLLAILSAEAGVSIVMVGEESYKARGSTREAKVAALLASIALKLETPPKDLGLALLQLKGKKPPENAAYKGRGIAVLESGVEVNCRDEGSLLKLKASLEGGAWSSLMEVCAPWIKTRVPEPGGGGIRVI